MTTKSNTDFYLTTAIYYANGEPHIGHAYEIIVADVIARFNRLIGKDVFFLTGTDEHGIKVQKTALKNNLSPKEYVDVIAKSFQDTWDYLSVSYSRFIRTTEPEHYQVVQTLWKQLLEKGDIYKATYKGYYCPISESFLTERDLTEEGLTPIYLQKPEIVEEENYFFRLSKYKDRIIQHLNEHPEFIQPEFRRNEVLNQLKELNDLSISRPKTTVSWGIPVPGDEDQIIYVWIDALSNYLTGADWSKNPERFAKFWPPDVQVIGKDILRFHAIYWPALLMAAELPLPQTLLVHGFINVGDTKISKSIGNVIAPADLEKRFELTNVDPIRYYMLSAASLGHDGSYTDEEFKNKINADLANNLGNLLNRTLNMTVKYFEGSVPKPDDTLETLITNDDLRPIRELYSQFKFNEVTQQIMMLVDRANKHINLKEPWTLHKDGKHQELANCLYAVTDAIRQVAIVLYPITPFLCQRIWEQLGYADTISEADWRWLQGLPIPSGQKTELGAPVMPRLESEIVGATGKKR